MRKLLAIALATATIATTATLFSASAASAAGPVKITAAYYDPNPGGPDPDTNAGRNQEYIVIRNSGSHRVTMTGWVLHDVPRSGSTNKFVFPSFKLRPGKTVRVHTGSGSNTSTDLYWGSSVYIWGDDSDTATLVRSGTTMSTCGWGTGDSPPKFC
jgi:P pilus assembly chaperone PapD